jgi:hypothetical protein
MTQSARTHARTHRPGACGVLQGCSVRTFVKTNQTPLITLIGWFMYVAIYTAPNRRRHWSVLVRCLVQTSGVRWPWVDEQKLTLRSSSPYPGHYSDWALRLLIAVVLLGCWLQWYCFMLCKLSCVHLSSRRAQLLGSTTYVFRPHPAVSSFRSPCFSSYRATNGIACAGIATACAVKCWQLRAFILLIKFCVLETVI